MWKRLRSPYRFAPPTMPVARIDEMLAMGAVASVQSSGRRSLKSVDLVTVSYGDEILEQFTFRGNAVRAARFVTRFNKAARALRPVRSP